MSKINKRVVSVKLSEATLSKVKKIAIKKKRTPHYLLCEAIEKEFK